LARAIRFFLRISEAEKETLQFAAMRAGKSKSKSNGARERDERLRLRRLCKHVRELTGQVAELVRSIARCLNFCRLRFVFFVIFVFGGAVQIAF